MGRRGGRAVQAEAKRAQGLGAWFAGGQAEEKEQGLGAGRWEAGAGGRQMPAACATWGKGTGGWPAALWGTGRNACRYLRQEKRAQGLGGLCSQGDRRECLSLPARKRAQGWGQTALAGWKNVAAILAATGGQDAGGTWGRKKEPSSGHRAGLCSQGDRQECLPPPGANGKPAAACWRYGQGKNVAPPSWRPQGRLEAGGTWGREKEHRP